MKKIHYRSTIVVLGNLTIIAFLFCIVLYRKGMFYRGNKSIPVFEWNKPLHTYKVQDVAQALLCDSKKGVCFCTPTNIEHNCIFLVDQSKLKSKADLRVDDSGSWKNNGVRCVIIAAIHGDFTIIAWDKEAKGYKMNRDQYQLISSIVPVKISERLSLLFLVSFKTFCVAF